MVRIANLTRVFRTDSVETTALNEIDMHIEMGEFVAVMGPSGCGKSTLLNIVGMLDEPTTGSYLFNGMETAGMTEQQRTRMRKGRIGFVYQNFNLIDDLTIMENVELPLAYLRYSYKERKRMVCAILERLSMGHRAKHFPNQLSGGQQQRVAIARAVVANPMLILADEPTGNLDSANGTEVMRLLTELNKQGSTVLMASHSERDAAYAHRVTRLLDGKVVDK
jgi:putative ABC transport system ATP-binding protein